MTVFGRGVGWFGVGGPVGGWGHRVNSCTHSGGVQRWRQLLSVAWRPSFDEASLPAANWRMYTLSLRSGHPLPHGREILFRIHRLLTQPFPCPLHLVAGPIGMATTIPLLCTINLTLAILSLTPKIFLFLLRPGWKLLRWKACAGRLGPPPPDALG